jgi:MFS family permease
VADRIGPRYVLVAGTLLSGILVMPHAIVGGIGTLYALRAALGLAAGAIGPAIGGFINRAVPRARHGTAFGIVQSANSLGFGLGPVTGGIMKATMGLRHPFVVVGMLQVVFALLAWKLLAHLPASRPSPETGPASD